MEEENLKLSKTTKLSKYLWDPRYKNSGKILDEEHEEDWEF